MSRTVSTRLEDDELRRLDEITAREHIDRSSLIRKFVLEQIKRYDMKIAADFYRKGLMSLQEAASSAKVSIYEMMEHVQQERIRPPVQSSDEIEKDIAESGVIFKRMMGIKNARK
nr:ribbon-helix-helix protein, CopG family [Candidatus Sigynarchaeota archaeon]